MSTYLVTIGLLLILLLGWVAVQRVYQVFARRHPELGPFRDDGAGCGACGRGGGGVGCGGASRSCGRDGREADH
jgi:hypothetical protein